MDEIKRRLENAVEAMNVLIHEERARPEHRWMEIDRLKAKREGIALALSYVEEEIRVGQSKAALNGK